MAIKAITHVFVYVPDQNEALSWYRDKLGFVVCHDRQQVAGSRWLTISPPGNPSTQLVLVHSNVREDIAKIGKNPTCVLISNDCLADCNLFETRGVSVIEVPKTVPWGISATLLDLYGNPYQIVQLLTR